MCYDFSLIAFMDANIYNMENRLIIKVTKDITD